MGLGSSDWFMLFLLGSCSGFAAGLLGIGGGFIVVPVLVFVFPWLGIDGPETTKIAAATALVLLVSTSLFSAKTHAERKGVDWEILGLLAPSVMLGAVVAPLIAARIGGQYVTILFVGVASYFAGSLIWSSRRDESAEKLELRPVGLALKTVVGSVIAAMLGVSTAFFAVPLLSKYVPMKRAIGTAAALGFPLSLVGSVGYLTSDTPQGCSAVCVGYVFLPGVIAIGATSALAAPVGAMVTQITPVKALKRIFAGILILAALHIGGKHLTLEQMLLGAWFAVSDYARPLCVEGGFGGLCGEPAGGGDIPAFLRKGGG